MNAKVALTALLLWAMPSVASAQEYLVVPETLRDAESRFIVRFGVGITPTFSSVSPQESSALSLTGDQIRSGNTILDGNLAFGTRHMLLPTLNSYVLLQGATDLRGLPTVSAPELLQGDERPSVQPSVYHGFRNGRAFLFHLGYAELDGLTREGLLSGLKLRAGRQFHWGVAPVTFDGATIGFDYEGFEAYVRAGQRSGVFDTTTDDYDAQSLGLLVGGNAGYTYASGDFHLRVRGEYVYFARTLGLIPRDAIREGTDSVKLESNLAVVSVTVQPMQALDVTARVHMALPDLSRVELHGNLQLDRTLVTLDFTQRVGRDVFYDLAGGRGFSRDARERTYESLRLNVPNKQPYSDLKAAVLFDLASWLEIGPSVGGRFVWADQEERTPFDANRVVLGLSAQSRFRLSERTGIELSGEYLGILYDRRADVTMGIFDDVSMGGEKYLHDLSVSLRYVRGTRAIAGRMLSQQNLNVGLFGYLTTATLDSRYVESSATEVSGGGGIDARVGLTRFVEVRGAYEFVRDSNILYSELGGFHLIKTSLEGRF